MKTERLLLRGLIWTLALAFLVTAPNTSYAAVTVDSSTNSGDLSQQTSGSWNHTVSGTNRYLVVGLAGYDTTDDMNTVVVKFNGQTMSQIGYYHVTGGTGGNQVALYGIVNPDIGTHTISVSNIPSGYEQLGGGSVSFKGVRQSSSLGTFEHGINSADHDLNLTMESGDIGVDIMYEPETIQAPPGANETTRVNQANGGAGSGFFMMGTESGVGTVTMDWQTSSVDLAYAAIVLKASSGLTSMRKPPNNLGLVGYWSFDEGTGAVATDFSGNSNKGTIASPAWTNGKFGNALNFTGSNTGVSLGSPSSLDNISTITLSAWIRPNSGGTGGEIFDKTTDGSVFTRGPDLWIETDSGGFHRLLFAQGFDNGTFLAIWYADNAIISGQWNHVVLTYSRLSSNNNPTFYVNGVKITPTADPGNIASGNAVDDSSDGATIGAYGTTNTTGHFQGQIDDVRIYNRTLSQSEITSLNFAKTTKSSASTATIQKGTSLASGLIGHWTFDGPSITQNQILDSSGNGNNGGFFGGSTSSAKAIGKLGQALKFDGVGTYVNFGDINALDGLTKLTVSAWIRSTRSGINQVNEAHILDKSNCTGSAGDGPFELVKPSASNNIELVTYDASGINSPVIGTSNIDDGQWHFVVGRYDGADETIWVDGVKENTTSIGALTLANNSRVVSTGGICGGQNLIWNGSIDDARVYNRALSDAEIKQLYRLGGTKMKQ